jgi:hypothetical protein
VLGRTNVTKAPCVLQRSVSLYRHSWRRQQGYPNAELLLLKHLLDPDAVKHFASSKPTSTQNRNSRDKQRASSHRVGGEPVFSTPRYHGAFKWRHRNGSDVKPPLIQAPSCKKSRSSIEARPN